MAALLSIRMLAAVGALILSLAGVSFLADRPTLAPEEPKPFYPALVRASLPDPEFTAEAVFVSRLRTGEVAYERNVDRKIPVASLTKLMTALLLAEVGRPVAEIVFTDDAKTAGDGDDKRSAVIAGDRLKVEDVERLLVASSDNDAAYAAAEYVAERADRRARDLPFNDRIAAFVRLMNGRASALGLANTNFANPAGRDHPENYSTARDLASLAGLIELAHPELWAASRVQEAFVFGRSGRRYPVVNTNPLFSRYPSLYGSKTGFDDEAKGALLMLYQLAPDELFTIVILRSADRFGDGERAINWLDRNFSFARGS